MKDILMAKFTLLALLIGLTSLLCSCGASESNVASAAADTVTTKKIKSAPTSRIPKISLEGSELRREAGYISVNELDQIGSTEFEIFDIYSNSIVNYEGMLLSKLVEKVASGAQKITFTAVDDYCVSFTREEWTTHPIILATKRDGERMTISQKGPARLVFDFNDDQESLRKTLKPKWIWQISRITFE